LWATFDLTGLPPTPDEIDAFLTDSSPNAWEKVIDRLLASKHYGEKWGRHWLDLVRYADTSGCNSDFPVPSAYKYRDYVIKAFNQDKPYDQFLKEQLAGDLIQGSELKSQKPEDRWDEIIATGYWPRRGGLAHGMPSFISRLKTPSTMSARRCWG
jgi:hypothetical protein